MYEDQALLASLQLRCWVVVVQEASAYYRKHSNSATAKATARGVYHGSLPNPSRSTYLTWLGQLLEVSGSRSDVDLCDAFQAALTAQESGSEGTVWHRTRDTALKSVVRLVRASVDGDGRKLLRRALRIAILLRRALRVALLRRATRAVDPLSRDFGFDSGTPIDRVYIEQFLTEHAMNIRGGVLEVGVMTYTDQFGGGRVTRKVVLRPEGGGMLQADLEQ
jgi:hypothetical protein